MRSLILCALVLGACGSGTTAGSDAGSTDGAVRDGAVVDAAPADAHPNDGGCGPDMILVHPCCGGPLPQCEPAGDGGMCAPGASLGQCGGPAGLQTGCVRQCTPPAPFCAPIPAGCGATPSCGCFSPDPCQGSSCGFISSGQIQCLCA